MLFAGAMILSHLRMPCRDTVYRLSAAQGSSRAQERMEVSMPQGPVDVNTGGSEQLQAIDGIGPVLAERIIDERMQNGPFHYPEDLLAVHGIGVKTLQKMRPQISINK